MRAALSYALPVIAGDREFLELGALLSYNVSERERSRSEVVERLRQVATPLKALSDGFPEYFRQAVDRLII